MCKTKPEKRKKSTNYRTPIFNIFRFRLKIWDRGNQIQLHVQCREIERIFRGSVFEIYQKNIKNRYILGRHLANFQHFLFRLKIQDPGNQIQQDIQYCEILRIFRERVFQICVILTSLASITQNFAKNFRILFPAFFCIPDAVICKKLQLSSSNGATEDHFLSKKSQNLTFFPNFRPLNVNHRNRTSCPLQAITKTHLP